MVIDPKKKTIHHDLTNIIFYTKNFKLFYYLQNYKKLGFLTEISENQGIFKKQGNLKKECFENQGILVIKEFLKNKEFSNRGILELFKNPTFFKKQNS